ncbi:MAG: choice-of-anchor D domain-containing protein, partial [Desulfuromonadales bacterium]
VPTVSAVNNTVLIGNGDVAKKSFTPLSALVSAVLSKTLATGYGSNILTIQVNGVAVLTDTGNGGLSGASGSGTINYSTGALTVDFNVAPAANQQVTVSYSYQVVTYSTYTRPNTADYLYSRKMPKIVYDPVRDNFWMAWSESRSKINSIDELFFKYGANAVVRAEFGDTTYPGYAVIKGSDLSFDFSKMGVVGADVVRNRLTNSNRFISGTETGLTATAEYEFFTNVTNVTLAVDTTSPEVLLVWDGLRNKSLLNVTCTDKNDNQYCDAGEVWTAILTPPTPYEVGQSHIYALFDKEIARPVVYSRYLENTTPDGKLPGNQSKKPAAGFDPIFKRFLVVWEDMRDGKTNKIFGQLVNSGVGSYNSNINIGFQDLTTPGTLDPNVAVTSQTSPTVSYDAVNQRHFVAWQDGRNGQVSNENMDIYGQFIDGEGTLRGSNYAIVTNISNQLVPAITYNTFTNQFLAVWKDARNSTTTASDIYGQLFSLGQPQMTLLKLDNTPLLPALLNFGSMSLSQFTSQSFKMRNTGDTSITLSSIVSPVDSTYSVVNSIPLLGIELVPGGEYVFSVKYTPTTPGTNVSSFTIKTDAGDRTVALQGEGISSNQLSMSVITLSQVTVPGDTSSNPAKVDAIDFGSLSLGTSSTKSMTIKNDGTIPYKITSISGIGTYSTVSNFLDGFTISSTDFSFFPVTLKPAESITVSMMYWSPVADERIQQIQINTDNSSLLKPVYLYGKTTAPSAKLSATTLDFGAVSASPAATKDLTFSISNTGNDTLKISSFGAMPHGYSIVSPTLPLTVQPGSSSLVKIRFTPSENISYSSSISILSNDPLAIDSLTKLSTLILNLNGTGTGPKLSVSPSQLDFGSVGSNTERTLPLTLLNTGNSSLTINSLTEILAPFTVVTPGALPLQLLPNTAVTVFVKYSPTAVGSNLSSLVINSDSIGGAQTIRMQGFTYLLNSGTVSINPSPISFPSTATGDTQSQNLVLTNTSLVPVKITNIDGPGSAFKIKNAPSLPYTLDAGATLALITSFSPTTAGSYNSNIGFLFDYLASPVNVGISGTSGATTASGSIKYFLSNVD